ncbi:SDR family oxidoreductase [Cytobacillus spongiae]|jgi:gluconate 5-dehydrogenase|uniref:SDR family oxidoreductase n=1 Tax=Cytobacillus spongiae TaxID=2901381 RepID=UPI001F2398BE|nr:SDR family oxidoreductase [Cytobacillus spongiae]UII55385.1 SDR family oxidoreductase [Cytobacillus spongiae]
MELFSFKGKTAIVTGGGSGLGRLMAIALGKAGANIVICSRNIKNCQEVCNELSQEGVLSLALSCDVTKKEEIQEVVNKTVEHFGTIDILINNSGTSWMAPTLQLQEDKWDKVMEVNAKGVFLFSQAVAKVMIQQGYGKIINMASVSGLGGTDPRLMDTIAYNTSKGAVIAFTKDLAVKLAPENIQVNAIAPGFFPTMMTKKLFEAAGPKIASTIPSRRFGEANDIQGVVLFLASSASDYVVGQTLIVDGGLTALI